MKLSRGQLRKPEQPSAFDEVYKVVRRIPRGRVATYGQIAKLLPKRWSPALVGWALHALPEGSKVPWHRVVDAKGQLGTRRLGTDAAARQEDLLEGEGVTLDAEGRCDLARHQWRTDGRGAQKR